MTPNEMTPEEVCDALAKLKGWEYIGHHEFTNWRNIEHVVWENAWRRGDEVIEHHPYPLLDLEMAALAFPRGWVWSRLIEDRESPDGWYAWKPTYYGSRQYIQESGNEYRDRYRLALACHLYDEEHKQ